MTQSEGISPLYSGVKYTRKRATLFFVILKREYSGWLELSIESDLGM